MNLRGVKVTKDDVTLELTQKDAISKYELAWKAETGPNSIAKAEKLTDRLKIAEPFLDPPATLTVYWRGKLPYQVVVEAVLPVVVLGPDEGKEPPEAISG